MSDIAQWLKTYNDTFYQFKKFTAISRFLCVKQLWIFHIFYLQALKELYYSPQQKILISIFEYQTRVVLPGQKPSAKLYLLILSLLLSFILSLLFLYCFAFFFNLLCVCFALIFWDLQLRKWATVFRSCIFCIQTFESVFFFYAIVSIQVNIFLISLVLSSLTVTEYLIVKQFIVAWHLKIMRLL